MRLCFLRIMLNMQPPVVQQEDSCIPVASVVPGFTASCLMLIKWFRGLGTCGRSCKILVGEGVVSWLLEGQHGWEILFTEIALSVFLVVQCGFLQDHGGGKSAFLLWVCAYSWQMCQSLSKRLEQERKKVTRACRLLFFACPVSGCIFLFHSQWTCFFNERSSVSHGLPSPQGSSSLWGIFGHCCGYDI